MVNRGVGAGPVGPVKTWTTFSPDNIIYGQNNAVTSSHGLSVSLVRH